MPTNLHALIRYRTIDECLTKRYRKWTWQDLADACAEKIYEYEGLEVVPSRRTIMYDLQYMRDGKLGYFAPIVYDRASKSYSYDDPDFSIQKFPLSKDDLFELEYALSILKNFKGFQNTTGIENIITKLEHTVTLQETSKKEIVHFDHSLNEPGQKWLHMLYDFIQNENALKITYQPFYLDQPYQRVISPYIIKEYDNRWFLICWDHLRQDIRNFALDRLLDIEKEPVRFYVDPAFDATQYFENIIGVTLPKDQKVEEIIFEAKEEDAKYLITKPLHISQQIIEQTAVKTTFSIQVIPNFELESIFLSLGERIILISPEYLREKIKARLITQLSQYRSDVN
ncbi:MAG: WYL domain-containing protein [Saprospiraceae bacterium]|nr:WYL domain-containing protein [Saprospiraceae bacterium]